MRCELVSLLSQDLESGLFCCQVPKRLLAMCLEFTALELWFLVCPFVFCRALVQGLVVSQVRAGRDAVGTPGLLLHFGSFLRSSGVPTDTSKTLQAVFPGTLWTIWASSACSHGCCHVHIDFCAFSQLHPPLCHTKHRVLLAVSCDGTWYLRMERTPAGFLLFVLTCRAVQAEGWLLPASASGNWFNEHHVQRAHCAWSGDVTGVCTEQV